MSEFWDYDLIEISTPSDRQQAGMAGVIQTKIGGDSSAVCMLT